MSLQEWAERHPEEVRACVLLMDVFGIRGYGEGGRAVYEQRDVGKKDRIHDFDLRLPDGCRVAVEVTRDIDPAARQFETMVSNEGGHPEGFPKVSFCLDHHWRIDIEPSPASTSQQTVRAIQDKIERLLKASEAAGETDPCFPTLRTPGERDSRDASKIFVRDQMQALGVRRAYHVDKWTEFDGPGKQITASMSGPMGWSGPDSVNGPVERHLKDDNLAKLQPAIDDDNAEAHLFVWVQLGDPVSAAALSAMRPMDLSEVEPPDLRGVDSVWLAVDAGWSPDLIRRVADETGYLPRRPEMVICRVTADGWERYCCEWRPGAPAQEPAASFTVTANPGS